MPVNYPKLPSLQYRQPSVEDASDRDRSRKRPRATDGEYDNELLQDIIAIGSISAAKAKHNVQDQDVDMREAPIEEENDKRDHQKPQKYSVNQRKAISRARSYGKAKDHYGVLDLEKSCTTDEVSRKYRKLVKLIHPLRTNFKDAGKALIRLNAANDILSNSKARKEYDKQCKRDKGKGKAINDEEFASNASGSDSVVLSADDSDAQSERMEPPDRMEFYEKATSAVKKILLDHEHKRSLSKIEKINREIENQNVEEGCDQTAFLISSSPLVEMGRYARTAQQSLAKNSNDKRAKRTMKHTAEQLQTVIRNFSYPSEWFPSEWLDFLTIEVEEEGSQMRLNKDKGREKQSSTSRSKHSPQETSIGKVKWRPGLTKNGEKILGYVPYVRRRGVYDFDTGKPVHPILKADFVIEKLGERNPMALITHKELGKRAYEAYMKLPKEQRNDLRRTEWKYADEDPDNFDEEDDGRLIAFASFETDSDYYPQGYGRYRRKDKSKVIMSRTCARFLFGQPEADREIQEFFPRIGKRIPWRKRIESSSSRQENRLAKATQYDSDISTSLSVELGRSGRSFVKLGRKARVRVESSGNSSSSSESDPEHSGISRSDSSKIEQEGSRRSLLKPDRKFKGYLKYIDPSGESSSRRSLVKIDRKVNDTSRDSSSSDSSKSEPKRSRQSLVDREGKGKENRKLDKVYREKVWRAALEKVRKDLDQKLNREIEKLAKRALVASTA